MSQTLQIMRSVRSKSDLSFKHIPSPICPPRTDRAECVRFLLNQGADPNPLYPGGNSSLHYAASLSGPTDILELLLIHGADVDILNSEGSSPLMFACQANNQFAASVLIAEGANVRQKNVHGKVGNSFSF